eukprot:TRINITY_DN4354_c0_g1_i1.p1 TRINITY_DN4354_c0_g1~~TRINITY_DN4354_c0_g1_i1.p1  ORF type:complete len:172 (-),score=16.70 TRINITY_DN4354_c0_g1_i1:940-1455(-)
MKRLIEICIQQGEDIPKLLLERSSIGTPITIAIATENSSMFQSLSQYIDLKKDCFKILFTFHNYPQFDVVNKFFKVYCVPNLIEEGDRSIGQFVGQSMNVDTELSTTLVKYLLENVKIKNLVEYWRNLYKHWSRSYKLQNDELIEYVHNMKDPLVLCHTITTLLVGFLYSC